jgi:hypothetical protein
MSFTSSYSSDSSYSYSMLAYLGTSSTFGRLWPASFFSSESPFPFWLKIASFGATISLTFSSPSCLSWALGSVTPSFPSNYISAISLKLLSYSTLRFLFFTNLNCLLTGSDFCHSCYFLEIYSFSEVFYSDSCSEGLRKDVIILSQRRGNTSLRFWYLCSFVAKAALPLFSSVW